MFKKKLKWNWQSTFYDGKYDLSEFIRPALAEQCPFKKIPLFSGGAKTAFDDVIMHHMHGESAVQKDQPNTSATIRTCGTTSLLLSKSFVITSPVDFVLSYRWTTTGGLPKEDIEFKFTTPENHLQHQPVRVFAHPRIQTETIDGSDILENIAAFKISFPIDISAETEYSFTDAIWHNKNPHRIIPGPIPTSYRGALQFFLHYPLVKEVGFVNHIKVHRGDALAYMYMHEKHKLVRDKNLPPPTRKKFIRGWAN